MNISRNVGILIFKNSLWIWLHLSCSIIMAALVYTTFRVIGLSLHVSQILAIAILFFDIIVSNIKFYAPNQAKMRVYWVVKYVYQISAALMLFLSFGYSFLLISWSGILFLIWGVFVVRIILQTKSEIEKKIRSDFGKILQFEMTRSQISPRKVALLTGVEESRILRFTRGEEQPSQHEAKTLFEFFGLTEEQLKTPNH